MKPFLISFLSRSVRLILALLLIYASAVFYFVYSERRIAFPRAIPHKEARAFLTEKKVDEVFCSMKDGTVLEGFHFGDSTRPLLVYFPAEDEDAAQFLAEAILAKNMQFLTFNYRGSGKNKGTPSEETFLSDAQTLAACAEKHSRAPKVFSGRGAGAILAVKVNEKNVPLILIDPIESLADRISSKYGIFFPKFLIRTKFSLSDADFQKVSSLLILKDRALAEKETLSEKFQKFPFYKREGETLSEALDKILRPETPEKSPDSSQSETF